MNQIMSKLQKYTETEYTSFIRVLFGQSSPTPLPDDLNDPDYGLGSIDFADPSLNDSQKEAIKFAMLSREIALIHGPPGVSNKTKDSRCSNSSNDLRPERHTH
jgi:DNA polymerase alpha-associated DNA helicase A